MKYTLEEIYDQATKDSLGIHQKHTNKTIVINYGYKIQKFSDKIEILNCSKGGDYFGKYSTYCSSSWSIKTVFNRIDTLNGANK